MNRLKLLLMTSSRNPSLWVFSSLGRPGPPFPAVVAGNFGKLVGRSDVRRRSDTFVPIDGPGIENLRVGAMLAWFEDANALGGNDGCAGEGEGEREAFRRDVASAGSAGAGIGLAEGGIGM